MPTLGDNKTLERVNETLRAHPRFSAKWAFTGYVLDEKEEPVNTYTGYLVCHKIYKIPRNSSNMVFFFRMSKTTFCAFDGIKYMMIMMVEMIIMMAMMVLLMIMMTKTTVTKNMKIL